MVQNNNQAISQLASGMVGNTNQNISALTSETVSNELDKHRAQTSRALFPSNMPSESQSAQNSYVVLDRAIDQLSDTQQKNLSAFFGFVNEKSKYIQVDKEGGTQRQLGDVSKSDLFSLRNMRLIPWQNAQNTFLDQNPNQFFQQQIQRAIERGMDSKQMQSFTIHLNAQFESGSTETLTRTQVNTTQSSMVNNLAARGVVTQDGVSISTPVLDKSWGQELGQKLSVMAGKGGGKVLIKLNPAHLGPLEASIRTTHESAVIQVHAAHAMTREALDNAIPRLKEMLAQQGFSQVSVDVSDRQFEQKQQAHQAQQKKDKTSSIGAINSQDDEVELVSTTMRLNHPSMLNGVVDYYT